MSTDTNYSITLKSKDPASLQAAAAYIELLSTPWQPGRRNTKTKVELHIFRNESNSRGFFDPESLCSSAAEMFPCVSILFSSKNEHGQFKDDEWPGKGPIPKHPQELAANSALEALFAAVSAEHERLPWLERFAEWAEEAGIKPETLKKINKAHQTSQAAETEMATTSLNAEWENLQKLMEEDKKFTELTLWQFHPYQTHRSTILTGLKKYSLDEDGQVVWDHKLPRAEKSTKAKPAKSTILFLATSDKILTTFESSWHLNSERGLRLPGFDHHNYFIGQASKKGFSNEQAEELRHREQKTNAEALKGVISLYSIEDPEEAYLFERDCSGILVAGFLWLSLSKKEAKGSVGIFCINTKTGKKEAVVEIGMESTEHIFGSPNQRQIYVIGHPPAEGNPGWDKTFKVICIGTEGNALLWETTFPKDHHVVGAASGDEGVLFLLAKRKTEGWNSKHLSGSLVCLEPQAGVMRWELSLANKCGGLFGGGFSSGLVADKEKVFFADSTRVYSVSWTGQVIWSVPIPEKILELAKESSQTAIEGLCLNEKGHLIVSAFGALACLQASDGKLVWINLEHGARTSPVVGPDGNGYLASFGLLKAIDMNNGKLKWSDDFSEEQDVVIGGCRPPVVTKDGKVYYHSNCSVRAVDAKTGSVHWRFTLSNYGSHCSPLVDSDGRIFIWGDDPPGVFCLKADSGGLDGPWPRLGCDSCNSNFRVS